MARAKKKPAAEFAMPSKGQVVRVSATRDGYRRAGVAHSKAPVEHAFDRFNEAQLKALIEDENISVEIGTPEAKE